MKNMFTCLLFFSLVSFCLADDATKQITKVSNKSLNIEAEVKDFYLHLVDTDQSVQKTMTSLILKACDSSHDLLESDIPHKGPDETRYWVAPETSNHYFTSSPRVVAWFPGEADGDVRKFNAEQSYLIVVAVSQSHHHGESICGAIVAEFRVVHTGTTKYDYSDQKAGRDPTLISNKITITFLGFRQFQLNPLQQQQ